MLAEPWHIQLFGGLRATQGERVVSRFRTQKTAALLAYLAYYRGRSHAREVLIELFWPDASEDSARHSLSLSLSSLRGQLEPPGTVAGSVIVADKLVVELNPAAFTTDVDHFEQALRLAAQARSDESRLEHLARAAESYGGELLPGYYEDWVASEQERLAGRFFDAVHQLVMLLEKAGDLTRALAYARRAVAHDPLREGAQRDRMRLLAMTGQPADALRQYREFQRRLAEELEEEPSSAMVQLVRQIEAQVPAEPLPGPVASSSQEPAVRPPRSAVQALPSGTVTFLLTDIEGSTALWERAGEAFRSALTLHHALLRHEFRRAGGHEVKEAGDSFLVAFASVSDALACAVAAQRALAAQPWPEAVGPLRVRMALHTGDVELEEEDYHGLPLHRASRMLQAAHGGQILCSEATAGLLRRDLEPEFGLTDLGVYRLRDVEGPERLFQVDYPDRPERAFGPLRAERAYAGRLPLQLTRFFGRAKELAQIETLLSKEPVRLLTLTGAGGTGKTRLGIEAAGRLREAYRGAVWFVPLADLTDPRLLPDAVLEAMSLSHAAAVTPMEAVVEALSRQPSLLVLDNLEQMVEAGAELVRTLLARVPALRLLVTSRQVLGLEGEREFVVEPLPTPQGPMDAASLGLYESVRLFVDRAQAVKPDFQVTNGNAPAVAELCSRLEGIPLAIELAAARAAVVSPTQMLYQLSRRFEFLVSRRRGVTERQRTLRAAVDWSYRLLAPELQRFFARLSVFRGGWTVEAAEAVCEEPLALDALAQLRESSLVQTETCPTCGVIRFRLLESLREYAEAQLSEGEREAGERRHAAHFLAVAEESEPSLTGPDQTAWLARLEAEHDNLRAALGWCARTEAHETRLRLAGALWRFWSVRGHFREGRRMLEEALSGVPETERSTARALALSGAGALAHDLGDYAAAALRLEESIALWQERGDRQGLATALNLLANVALDRDAYERATTLYQEALTLWRELGDIRGQAMTLSNLGALAEDRGAHDEAAELLTESVRLKRALGNAYGLAISLDTLGNVERSRGNLDRAVDLYGEALGIRHALGHKQGVAMSLCNRGRARLDQGQPDAAREHLLESLSLFEELEDVPGSVECLSNLTGTAFALGRPKEAARLMGAVRTLRHSAGITPSAEEKLDEERTEAAVRAAVGQKALDRLAAAGESLTLEQARELARTSDGVRES